MYNILAFFYILPARLYRVFRLSARLQSVRKSDKGSATGTGSDTARQRPMQALIVYRACEPLPLQLGLSYPLSPLVPRPLQHFCHTIDDRSKAAPRGGGVTRRRRCASDRLLSDDTKSLFGHWPGLAWPGLARPDQGRQRCVTILGRGFLRCGHRRLFTYLLRFYGLICAPALLCPALPCSSWRSLKLIWINLVCCQIVDNEI